MNSEEVLSLYETVASLTHQMLAAARESNWEKLAELELRCAKHIDILKQDTAIPRLTGVGRERKAIIIQKILADDREIRSLTEPWMEQLSAILNNAGTKRKLSQVYGPNQSS